MPGWLDDDALTGALGSDLLSAVPAGVMAAHAEAVEAYVEDRRPDLWTTDVDEAVFEPPLYVVFAAAMLAYRTVQNRTKPEVETADSADLAAMLGIRKHRRFGFGGARRVPVYDEAVAP